MSERRKPEKRKIGESLVNRSDFEGLQRAWKEKNLVLFLGNGVSMPYGIPAWKDLVLEILFDQTDVARRLEPIEIPHRRALASWLVDYYEYDPVVLARVVKNEIRRRASRGRRAAPGEGETLFLEKVREHLYPSPPLDPPEPTALTAVADLIKKSSDDTGVTGVVTFNFDDLLERKLAGTVDVRPIWSGRRQEGNGFPILHPHGYLPQDGDLEDCNLVFTEDDYHDLTTAVFHWALTSIVSYLRHSTVLFIGLSMLDPNLRRLLDAAYVHGDVPAHWQVQKRHKIPEDQMPGILEGIERRAQRYGEVDVRKDVPQLEEAVQAVLHQADSYDRNLFESMGVKTIWVEDYDDIPALLERIPAD
ncbi:MAG TPA: SIR2 family protein [Thermoanaerobaculia bacterium]|nr:SIR2 family protein [Thermoanaerobaculia bacterium]